MKYNEYIKGETPVSEIGFGAWQLGISKAWTSMSDKEANDLVIKALESGVNFFDTAPGYGLGTSELRLGEALKGTDRDKYVINTKFGHMVNGQTDFSSKLIRESLEGSLKRLQVDYIDSLIIHNPPFEILDGNKNDHYEILERLIDEGKIKAYGASLDTFDEMKLFMDTTKGSVIEAFYNILHQDTAKAFQQAIENEVRIIAKIPLDSGWLSGKYNANTTFSDIRNRWSKSDINTRLILVEKVKSILTDNHPLPQAAIAFCLANNAITTVIPGNKSIEQLVSNVESVSEPLSKQIVQELEEFYQKEVRDLNLPW